VTEREWFRPVGAAAGELPAESAGLAGLPTPRRWSQNCPSGNVRPYININRPTEYT